VKTDFFLFFFSFFFSFVELIISFLFIFILEKNYVYTQVSKYVMVARVYTSHIGFNSIIA